MTSTSIIDDADADQPGMARPHQAGGRVIGAWASPGNDLAGASTRTTAADMARFAQAIIDGSAPGLDATTPQVDTDEDGRIGLAWFIIPADGGGSYLWHNGGTGGSRTVLAIDLTAKVAAVVLGNSEVSVDGVGQALIHRETPQPESPSLDVVTVLPIAVAVLLVMLTWWRAWRASSRSSLAAAVADAGTASILARVLGPWHLLPVWLLGSLLACAVVGAVFAVARMRAAPTLRGRRAVAVLDVAISMAVLGLASLLVVG